MNLGITPNFNINQSQVNKNQKTQNFGAGSFPMEVFEKTPFLKDKPTVNTFIWESAIPLNIAKKIEKLMGNNVVVLNHQEDGMLYGTLNCCSVSELAKMLKGLVKNAKPGTLADAQEYQELMKKNSRTQAQLRIKRERLEREERLINSRFGI